MGKESAGLLMYRQQSGCLEFLLVHPGGPFWKNKDAGVWSIPKGEVEAGEDPLVAAQREFAEETGVQPTSPFIVLAPVKLKSGKTVRAWAFEGDCDPSSIKSNLFEIDWPPRSGRKQQFPEIDRAGFFDLTQAAEKINPAQLALLEELVGKVSQ